MRYCVAILWFDSATNTFLGRFRAAMWCFCPFRVKLNKSWNKNIYIANDRILMTFDLYSHHILFSHHKFVNDAEYGLMMKFHFNLLSIETIWIHWLKQFELGIHLKRKRIIFCQFLSFLAIFCICFVIFYYFTHETWFNHDLFISYENAYFGFLFTFILCFVINDVRLNFRS